MVTMFDRFDLGREQLHTCGTRSCELQQVSGVWTHLHGCCHRKHPSRLPRTLALLRGPTGRLRRLLLMSTSRLLCGQPLAGLHTGCVPQHASRIWKPLRQCLAVLFASKTNA
jgi:hypothetical protein